jgi:hypothetical protein
MIAKMERFFTGSVNLTSAILLVVALSNFALFGQTSSPSAVNKTFRVRGTITDPSGAVIPKAKIVFRSKQASRTINADAKGSYEADLPFGNYEMEITSPLIRGFSPYRRPLFRVTSQMILVLNVTLPMIEFCDPVVVNMKSPCGGEDRFPVPAADGTPFEVYVRYAGTTADGRSYASRKISDYEVPVLVEYNLFTLRANRVTYDPKLKIVQADGNVVIEDHGAAQRWDSATFRMENGQAIRIP